MKFTIVTPSFNSGRWLPRCLASVADQGVELEHLVQDGGSTDGTLDWLRKRDGIGLEVKEDRGMYDALNRGFRRGSGELCAYLNCDEQYLPDALRAAEQFFEEHGEVDVLFADTVGVDVDGTFVCHRQVLLPTRDHTLLCHLATLSAAMFFRRRVLDAGHWFDPDFRAAGDVDWIARLLAAKVQMDVLRRYTSAFTFTGGNLSQSGLAAEEQSRLAARLPVWRRWLRPVMKVRHRVRRLLAGVYRQVPFEYSVHVAGTGGRRLMSSGPKPSWRWPTPIA